LTPTAPRGPMQPDPNALLAQEKALASDALGTAPNNPASTTAASFAGDCRDTRKKRVTVFISKFLL
jgi:hypothetical protein